MTEDKDSLLEQMRKGRQTFEKMENIIILEFAKYLGVILLHIL